MAYEPFVVEGDVAGICGLVVGAAGNADGKVVEGTVCGASGPKNAGTVDAGEAGSVIGAPTKRLRLKSANCSSRNLA